MEPKKLGGSVFTVLSDEHLCGDEFYSVKCTTQDYFTEAGVLRIQLNGSVQDVYNDFHSLQGLAIPLKVDVAGDRAEILAISVVFIGPLSPNEKMLSKDAPTPANMQSITRPLDAKPGPGVKRSKLIHFVQPIYPMLAKQEGVEGTVVVNASIDEKGNVREPYIVVPTGTQLDRAALDSIRRGKYEPLQIDGVPYSIDTTISVVFSLSH